MKPQKIDWQSLQRYYARGQLILVNPDLDLVDIAVRIALDDSETISGYLERTLLQKPDDDMAKQWLVGGESFCGCGSTLGVDSERG